jgi:hypothetical protein
MGSGAFSPYQIFVPYGLAVDAAGNVYVAASNDRVVRFDRYGNPVKVWGATGTGAGQFRNPAGIAVDRAGNVYVADRDNARVQKFDGEGNLLAIIGAGLFNHPWSVAVDPAGNIYVSDDRVARKFDAQGNLQLEFGDFAYPSLTLVQTGIALDPLGNVLVLEANRFRVNRFSPDGTLIAQFGTFGSGDGQLVYPSALVVDWWGNTYITDTGNNRVQKFDPAGNYLTQFSMAGGAFGIAQDDRARIYVGSNGGGSKVAVFEPVLVPVDESTPGGVYPILLTALDDPAGKLANYTVTTNSARLTIDYGLPRVTWLDPDPVVYGAPLGAGQLNAAANQPGVFVYSPPLGTVLNTGTNELITVFTPHANYAPVTNRVSLVVTPAEQVISFDFLGTPVRGQTVPLTASASSGLPVLFTVVSGRAVIAGNQIGRAHV